MKTHPSPIESLAAEVRASREMIRVRPSSLHQQVPEMTLDPTESPESLRDKIDQLLQSLPSQQRQSLLETTRQSPADGLEMMMDVLSSLEAA